MNRKKIMEMVVASVVVAGSITLSSNVALADEVTNEPSVMKNSNIDNSNKSQNSNSGDLEITEDNNVEQASSRSLQKGKIVNVTTNVRIRNEASMSSSTIGYLLNNTDISVIEKTGDWYKITYGSVTGYVYKDYVQVLSSAGQASSSSSGKVVNVTSFLNIRNGAGTNHGVIGHLGNGESVEITGESGNWYSIKFGTQTGYVDKDYVQKGNSPSSNSGSSRGTATSTSSEAGTVVNVTSNLRVRQAPGTSSSVLGYLVNNQGVSITGQNGNFYAVNFNGKTGYVSKDYVKEGQSSSRGSSSDSESKTGAVTASALNVRSGASTSSSILGTVRNGQSVSIQGESGNFYKISFNGTTAYVSKDYIRIGGGNSISQSDKYNVVLNNMKAHLGTPYCWGGYGQLLTTSSLNALKKSFPSEAALGRYSRLSSYVNKGYRAYDCSGLMQWGFEQAGISIGRTTWDQIGNGHEVALSSIKPGDLLFYSNLQHVGMYIGNGQWIESPNSSASIRIANVPWRLIGRARRVL